MGWPAAGWMPGGPARSGPAFPASRSPRSAPRGARRQRARPWPAPARRGLRCPVQRRIARPQPLPVGPAGGPVGPGHAGPGRWSVGCDHIATWSHWPAGQPVWLSTMNFGPETDETTGHQIMDAARCRDQLLTPPTSTAAARPSSHRRWFAQGGGRREKVAGHLGTAAGLWPNTSRLSAHLRQACETACAGCRPTTRRLPDAPRRSTRRGTRFGGPSSLEGDLRRQLELRRLAPRTGQRGRPPARLARARVGAEPVQPAGPHGRAGRFSPRPTASG